MKIVIETVIIRNTWTVIGCANLCLFLVSEVQPAALGRFGFYLTKIIYVL